MTLSSDDLLPIVHRFYPKGMNEYDPGYKETEEHRRLIQARVQASAGDSPWTSLLDRLNARFPGAIMNGSVHLPTGGWDAGYIGRLVLPTRGAHEKHHELSLLISFLAPCYVIYSASIVIAPTTRSSGRTQEVRFAFTPDEEPYVRAVSEEISSIFPGYEPLPPEVGNVVVPDVVAGNQAMGKTTLFHCLFTDAW